MNTSVRYVPAMMVALITLLLPTITAWLAEPSFLAAITASFAEPYSLVLSFLPTPTWPLAQQLATPNDVAICAVLQPILLNAKQVAELIGVSKSLFHRMVAEASFPLGKRLSSGRTAWTRTSVEEWCAALPERVDPVRVVRKPGTKTGVRA